jgi:hypothetical protein
MKFFQYQGGLYTHWIDTNGGSTSSERRNKVKEVYPNIGVEKNLADEYLGYPIRISNEHISLVAGKIHSINSDLTLGTLKYTSSYASYNNEAEFKEYTTAKNIMNALPIYTSDSKGVEIVKNDLTSFVLEGKSGKNEVAVYDDKVITIGYNGINHITTYDRDSNKIAEVTIGKSLTTSNELFERVDINKNQILALGDLEWQRAYLAVADLSNDIVAPNITLSNTETDIEVGDSVTLNWTATDNNNELTKYEVYKVTGGEEYLLGTITNLSQTTFTYTQESSSEKFIQLKVVAYDGSGNTNYATLPLKVHKKIIFSSFTLNKTTINLGEQLTFSWSSSGGDESTQFTIYKKAVDESEWNLLFTTMGNSKSYVVKDFVGEYQFKIVSGSSSLESSSHLVVNGELLDFKEELFIPRNSYYKLGNNIKFEWADTLTTTSVLYDVWLKKSGESQFTLIGSTPDKYLEYFDDINGSFAWKVSAKFGEAIVESNVIQATVALLESPQISDINFTLDGDRPMINLAFPNMDGVDGYAIVKEHDGIYEEIPIGIQSVYQDTDIHYGMHYTYYVVAIKDGIKTELGEPKDIVASIDERFEVIIDTADSQLLNSNSLNIEYHPNREVAYERYEIWLGSTPDDLMQYDITQSRNYLFENLKYATNYYVEIYAIDFNGNHISAVPAKLQFTTGFDNRNITEKPVISVDEVNSYSIKLSWTEVQHADEYKICRRDNGGRYSCFVRTKELSYIDTVNIDPENSYQYIVQALNGADYENSEASQTIVTPLSDYLRVIQDKVALTFDTIRLQNTLENNITGDLSLTQKGVYDSNITWSCNSTLLDTSTGVITKPTKKDMNVTLRAFIQYGKNNDTKEFHLIIKKNEDSDNDGIPDTREKALGMKVDSNDSDGDNYLDSEEIGDIYNPTDTDNDNIIDALDLDSDNDGMEDSIEKQYGFNPKNKGDATEDADGDGVNNLDEIRAGTNPKDGSSIPTIESGLQLYLNFNHNVNDSSKSANHGVAYGGIQYGVGAIGQAGYFDGIDDYVRVLSRDNINFKADEDFSISIWILPHHTQLAPTGDNDILEKWSGGADNYPYVVRYNNSNHNIVCAQYDYNKSEHKNPAIGSLKINHIVYNHIVFMKKSHKLYLYQNGNLIQTKDVDLHNTISSSDLFIAVRGNMINQFRGYIDELRVYNRALPEVHISELFSQADKDAIIDTDEDGLFDKLEKYFRLNVDLNDTDGDGYLDSEEVGDGHNAIDTDSDGIIDALDLDSDDDNISDKDEKKYGFNPRDKNDATQDADGDGVNNLDEIRAGTNPLLQDYYSLNVRHTLYGYIYSDDGNIQCDQSYNQCSYLYKAGHSVNLSYTENENSSYRFDYWKSNVDPNETTSDDILKTNPSSYNILMYKARTVEAIPKRNIAPSVQLPEYIKDEVGSTVYIPYSISDVENDEVSVTITNSRYSGRYEIDTTNSRIIFYASHFEGNNTFTFKFDDRHGGIVYKTIIIEILKGTSVNHITPITAILNEPTTFIVTGEKLPSTLTFWIDGCHNITSLGGSAITHKFNCIPSDSTGQKNGIVKDKPEGNPLKTFTITVTPPPDTDGDNIPDKKEIALGLNPNNNDSDGDSILDGVEIGEIDTPRDTDGDNMIDALESNTQDHDGDNVADAYDINNTSPNSDSDGDNINDKDESTIGTNPLDNSSTPTDTDGDNIPNAIDTDDDNDNLTDTQEERLGTNSTNPDTDNDGYNDANDHYPNDPTRWEETKITLTPIENVYILPHTTLPPIAIEANTNDGSTLTFHATSSQPEVVRATIQNNLLTLTALANKVDDVNITITATHGTTSKYINFTTHVKHSLIYLENNESGAYRAFEKTHYSVEVNATTITVTLALDGTLTYSVTKEGKTTQLKVTIAGLKVQIDHNYVGKVILPTQKEVHMRMYPDGRVVPHIEGATLPQQPLPLGTSIESDGQKVRFTIPMQNRLTF